MIPPPRRISLCGGGARAPGHIGALLALEEVGYLRHVKELLGISCGALIAFAMCIGYTLKEISQIGLKMDLSVIQDLDPEKMLQLPTTFGLDSGENLEKFLRALVVLRGLSPALTFSELVAAGASPYLLRIFVTDLNRGEPKEFSATRTPAASVVKATLASMSIPVYFCPVVDEETGHLLVDGGAYNHVPFWCIPDAEKEDTLCLNFSEENLCTESINSFGEFATQVYYSAYTHIPAEVRERWKHHSIWIHCGDYPVGDFGVAEEKKLELQTIGYNDVKRALVTPRGSVQHRRRGSAPAALYR